MIFCNVGTWATREFSEGRPQDTWEVEFFWKSYHLVVIGRGRESKWKRGTDEINSRVAIGFTKPQSCTRSPERENSEVNPRSSFSLNLPWIVKITAWHINPSWYACTKGCHWVSTASMKGPIKFDPREDREPPAMQNIVFSAKSLAKFDLPNMISTGTRIGFFMEEMWRAPKFLVDPFEGPSMR
jgi:hypothetical protein